MYNFPSVEISLLIHTLTPSYVFVAFAGTVVVVLLSYGRRYDAYIFAISFMATTGTVVLLKYAYAVPRPTDALITLTDYAFPSAHSAFSALFSTSIGWLYFKNHWFNITKNIVLLILLYIPALVVGLSRLTLKVHTPFQVLVGFCIGVVVPFVVILLAQKYSNYCTMCKK